MYIGEQSNQVQYTALYILQALFTIPLSVLKFFLGGKVQQYGMFLQIYNTSLALSTILKNEIPVNHWLFMVIKKLLIACHQISPVQEKGCFGFNMMHHASCNPTGE